jgi:hypothetical protein
MVKDRQPFITIKKARIARSGDQMYSKFEIACRGVKPVKDKEMYVERRPAEVLIKNLDKFRYLPLTIEHVQDDIDSTNWKDSAVGFIGGNPELEVLDDGNVYITNDVVFYSEDAYNAYQNGVKELSVGYDAETAVVSNPDAMGCDLLLTDIPSCNHLALVPRGRAGSEARVLDSIDNLIGGKSEMGKGFSILSALGIGKRKEEKLAFSSAVFDSLSRVAADGKTLEAEVSGILKHVSPLGDGADKDTLIRTVADSYRHPAEVLEKKDEVAKALDAMYGRCLDADEKAAKAVLDEITGRKKEEKPGEKGEKEDDVKDGEGCGCGGKPDGKPVKDAAPDIDEIVKRVRDSFKDDIDRAVKAALGVADDKKVRDSGSETESDYDVSFLMKGAFGM